MMITIFLASLVLASATPGVDKATAPIDDNFQSPLRDLVFRFLSEAGLGDDFCIGGDPAPGKIDWPLFHVLDQLRDHESAIKAVMRLPAVSDHIKNVDYSELYLRLTPRDLHLMLSIQCPHISIHDLRWTLISEWIRLDPDAAHKSLDAADSSSFLGRHRGSIKAMGFDVFVSDLNFVNALLDLIPDECSRQALRSLFGTMNTNHITTLDPVLIHRHDILTLDSIGVSLVVKQLNSMEGHHHGLGQLLLQDKLDPFPFLGPRGLFHVLLHAPAATLRDLVPANPISFISLVYRTLRSHDLNPIQVVFKNINLILDCLNTTLAEN